jgi:hypothetical protein
MVLQQHESGMMQGDVLAFGPIGVDTGALKVPCPRIDCGRQSPIQSDTN